MIGWTFHKEATVLKHTDELYSVVQDTIYHGLLKDQACFSDYEDDYKSTPMLVCIRANAYFAEVVKQFLYKNISVEILRSFPIVYGEVKNKWGIGTTTSIKKGDEETSERMYIVKLDSTLPEPSRYLTLYLIANVVRMFHLEEPYIKAVPYKGEPVFEYITNAVNYFTNGASTGVHYGLHHLPSKHNISVEMLMKLDNLDEVFPEDCEIPRTTQTYYDRGNVDIGVGHKVYQTSVCDYIKEKL